MTKRKPKIEVKTRWHFGDRCVFSGFKGNIVAVGFVIQVKKNIVECQGIIIYHKINPLLIGSYLSWSMFDSQSLKKDNQPTKEQWNKYQVLLKSKFRQKK